MSLTSLDRVLSAVQGIPQERPPFTMTLSLYGARLTGCPLSEYYRSPDRYLAGQMAVLETFGPDILFAPFALPLEAEAFGSELVFFENNPPNVRKPAFSSFRDTVQLTMPVVDDHPGLSFIRESTRLLAGKLRGEVPVCAIMTAPTDLPAILFGIEGWLEILLFDEDRCRRILDIMHRHFVGFANELFSAGANFIALPIMFTSPRFLTPPIIRDLVIPALERSFHEVAGPLVFHHGGNPIATQLKDFAHLPNIAGFALDARDDFREARAQLGPDRLLLGGLNGPTLSSLSADQARTRVAAILRDRASDFHYIFATAAADIPWQTPVDTIQAVSETIRTYRKQA